MKKILLSLAVVLTTLSAAAQTLNVQVGNVTYQFPSSQTGDMTFSSGTTMTVMGKTFTISDITSMYTDETTVTDDLVTVTYSTSGDAAVTIPGNVAMYIVPSVNGNTVSMTQLSTYSGTDYNGVADGEITYQLSGTTTDGSFTLGGSYKSTISLAGVDLTCTSGAAIAVSNSKRIQLSAKSGTTNTIADGSGTQKACIYSKGQLQLQGKGTLNVVGNYNHGIKSASYISIKNLTLNITSTVGDGINCEEYFQMKSGTVTLSGIGDDGIQCDYGDETALTGETTDHEDEDTGNIYLEGGTLTITTSAAASKGIKSNGDIVVTDGTYTVTTTGKYAYDEDDAEYKSCACMSADEDMTVSGGTLTLKSTGYAGKGIKVDGTLTISDGTVSATTTGSSNDTYGSAKAIKAGTKTETSSARAYFPGQGGGGPGGQGGQDEKNYTYSGGIVISGGTIIAKASSHEAIESKNTLDISGGDIYAESSDDAINAASHLTITGGYVMANSTGNDGIDANGNMYIKGGNVFAVATTTPEVGLDANTEGGYQLYITGGNVIAIGGLENGASVSTSKSSVSYSKGSWYAFKSGGTTQFSFKVPSNSSMGSSMVICSSSSPSVSKLSSTPSGTSVWNGNGVY